MLKYLPVLALCCLMTACGTRSSGTIEASTGAGTPVAKAAGVVKDPKQVAVVETDITNRKYHSLGDISVTVSKNTIFDHDPTRDKVNEALQERAAKLGADAVILVRYGTVAVTMMSWGALDGNGRAIAYDD